MNPVGRVFIPSTKNSIRDWVFSPTVWVISPELSEIEKLEPATGKITLGLEAEATADICILMRDVVCKPS